MELLNVIVSVEVPPAGTFAGVNDFATVGGLRLVTVSWAVAGEPLGGPFDEVTALAAMVLSYIPGVMLVTSTVTVQEPMAGTVPPLSETNVPPFPAVTVPPAHVVAPFAGVALTRLAG